MGIKKIDRRRKFTDSDKKKMREMFFAGFTYKKIMKEYGISNKTLYYIKFPAKINKEKKRMKKYHKNRVSKMTEIQLKNHRDKKRKNAKKNYDLNKK